MSDREKVPWGIGDGAMRKQTRKEELEVAGGVGSNMKPRYLKLSYY